MALRRPPAQGDRVRVAYLGSEVRGVVERVSDGGRELTVVDDEGHRLVFQLNRATGRFTERGELAGARLHFL